MRLTETTIELPGVPEPNDRTRIQYVMPSGWSAFPSFAEFRAKALAAMQRSWFPVYRMADGEFAFAVGPRGRGLRARARRSVFAVRQVLRRGRAIRTMWGESYSHRERSRLLRPFMDDLADISRHGAVAVHFIAHDGHDSREYVDPLIRFFERCGIEPRSLLPFHYVLTLLTGEGHEELFTDRTVGVLTTMTLDKQAAVTETLMRLGVRRVLAASLPQQAPLLAAHQIELAERPDVILVGAGIGSTAVLQAAKRYATLTLDVGGFIEALARPSFEPHALFRLPSAVRSARQ